MKQRDGKSLQFSAASAVRLQGYARRRRHLPPWIRLGTVALIVITVAITAAYRQLSHRSGGGRPFAAASLKGGSDGSKPQPASSLSPSGSMPAVSANLLTRAEAVVSVAPPQQPNGNATGSQAPSTTTHATTKPIQENSVLAPAPSTSAGSSTNGHRPGVRDGSGHRYRVQVGALADRASAEELAERLRVLGYAVRIVGSKPFLVWVGGYLDEPTAGRLVSRLRGQGFDAVLNAEGTPPL
jgi:hypothetical protein